MGTLGTAPSAGSTTSIDDERHAWFETFGYTGELDEVVTLRFVPENASLGIATAEQVWRVRQSLMRLKVTDTIMFRRLVTAAAEGWRPVDRDRILSEPEHGSLTNGMTGEFNPGIAEIIVALVDVDPEEMDGEFAKAPIAIKHPRRDSSTAA